MGEDGSENEEGIGSESTSRAASQISDPQARSLAIQTATETPGNYGRRFRKLRMVHHIVELQEDQGSYTITMTFRPQGPFYRVLGRETFWITKDGAVVDREVVLFHGRVRNWLAIGIILFLGIFSTGGPVIVAKVLSARGASIPTVRIVIEPDYLTPSLATQPPAPTSVPAPTQSPLPAPTQNLVPAPAATTVPAPAATTVPAPTATRFPTPTALPTNTPEPRSKYTIGDELLLTMGRGDALRQFPATVLEIYRLGDSDDPYWEYQIRWADGLLRAEEFILSMPGKAIISYEKAVQSVTEAVAAERLTAEEAEEHLYELVAQGFAAGPPDQNRPVK